MLLKENPFFKIKQLSEYDRQYNGNKITYFFWYRSPARWLGTTDLQDLKDMLLTSWSHIPQHNFRGLVESMPRQVRTVLAAKGGPTQYQAGGHDVASGGMVS